MKKTQENNHIKSQSEKRKKRREKYLQNAKLQQENRKKDENMRQ
jgi:hypothetical protein